MFINCIQKVLMQDKGLNTITKLAAKPLWLRIVSAGVCFIFVVQQAAYSLDFSELNFDDKKFVEKQGISAAEFLQQAQNERDYLLRQQKVAAVLNGAAARNSEDLTMNLFGVSFEQFKVADDARKAIEKAQNVVARAGSGVSGFSYVKYNDGKTVWMKDNLPEKIINEIVKDKDGHTTLRSTYNMVYNSKRLLLSYDADMIDSQDNKTTIDWRNAAYTNDSVFYANDDTVANKHLTNYVEIVTDQTTGNSVVTTFENPVYQGKDMLSYVTLVQDGRSPDKQVENDYADILYDAQHNMAAYTQAIKETLSLGGNTYSRVYTQVFTGCQYDANKNLTAYTEAVNDEWGQTTTNFTGTYNQFNELTSSIKEETFQDGTSTTVKFSGDYDDNSRLMHSTEVTTDSRYPNLSSTRIFTAGVGADYGYNQHGDLTSYTEETIGNDGKITVNQWYGAQYDNHAQLLTYQQDITDSLGDTMHKVWAAGTNAYNGLNQLSSYIVDTYFGNLVIHEAVTGAVYDYLGQLAQSNDTTTITGADSLGNPVNYNKTVVRHDPSYSAAGQLSGFTEDTSENAFDSAGNVIYALHTQAVDTNVSLAGYTEVKTVTGNNYQDTTTTTRTDTQYNSAKQITGYTEKVVDSASLDAYTMTTRQDILYNSLGQMIAYSDKVFNSNTPGTGRSQSVTDVYNIDYDSLSNVTARTQDSTSVDGIKTNTQISDIEYNGFGQQVSYDQVQTQFLSTPVITTTARGDIQYNQNGLLASYIDTVTSTTDNLTRITDWQADTYYPSGQLEAYYETTTTTGTDIFGTAVDFSNTTEMLQMSYNSFGLMVSSHEEDSSSAAPDVLTTKDTTGMVYDNYGQLAEFTEDKWDIDSIDPALLDLHIVTTRYDSTFQNGRLFSYTEEVYTTSDNGDLDTSMTTARTNIGYDQYGRMNFYNDKITTTAAADKTSYVTWQGLSFDATGAVLSYRQTTHDLGIGLDVTTVLTRSNIIYNSLQQAVSYIDTIDSSATPDKSTTDTRTKTSYNALGQISTYSEQDEDTFTASGFVNVTQVNRYAMQYDLLNQLIGYDETTQSSLTPQIITTVTWSSLGYDINGNLSGYDQRDQQTNDSGTLDLDNTTIKENMLYNGLGQVESYKQTTIQAFPGTGQAAQTSMETITAIDYDINGQLLDSTETSDDGYTQTTDTRSGMDYNAQGFLDAYTDTIHQTNNDGLVSDTKSTWEALDFYDNGRVKDYQQTTQGQSSAGAQTLQQNDTLTRTNIVYDNNGFTLSYDEADTSLSDTVTSSWQAQGYDCFGRVLAYTQSGQNSSSGPFSLARSDIEYATIDNTSRVIAYTEAGSADGDIYNKSWYAGTIDGTGATYNLQGNLVNYYETGFDTNRGAYTLAQTNAAYNAFGEVLTYIEAVTNVNGGVTITTRSNTDYNDLGQVEDYQQTTINPDGSQSVTTWHNPVYDALSRLTAYDQTDFIPGLNQTTTTHWQANFSDSYLDNGFLNHYATTKDSSDAAGTFSTHTVTDWKALSVNNNFQATDYQETVTTNSSTTAANDPDYDLLTDAQQQDYQSALATTQTSSVVTTTRTNINYDDRGLVLSYSDNIAQDNGSTTLINWQASGYDNNGLTLGYTQDVTVTGDNLSQQYTVTRTIVDYDTSLRPKDYIDIETNSGVATTTLMNDVTYNAQGEEVTWTKTVTSQAEGNGTEFDYTTTTWRLNTDYCGSYACDYTEESTSDLDAITTTIHVFGIVYDSHGNQASYITTTHRIGESTQNAYYIGNDPVSSSELTQVLTANPGIDLSTVFTVKQVPFSLDDQTIAVSYGLIYNGINQLLSDNQLSFDETNNLSTLTSESNILYNDKDQRIAYDTTTHQQGGSQAVFYCDSNGAPLTADSLKALLNANPGSTIADLLNQGVLTRLTQSASIDDQSTVDRTNILYNNFGQVVSYDDLTIVSGTTSKSHVENITYDDKNRESGYTMTAYNRNDYQPSADFVLSSTVTRTNQLYNDLGQVLSYCDTTVTPSSSGTVTKIDNFNFQYNNAGQVALSIDNSSYCGQGLATVYSANGTVLSAQALSDLEAPNPGKSLFDLIDQGVITQSSQTFDSGAMPSTTTVRFDFNYNAAGQAVGYTDLSATAGQGGYDLSKTSDIAYTANADTAFSRRQETSVDSDGQQTVSDTLSFREYSGTILTSAGDIATSANSDGYFYQGVSRTENDYAIVYNQAQLTTATTNTVYTNFAPNSGDTSGTVTQTTTYGYDRNGQLNSMRAASTTNETDAFGNQNNSTTFQLYTIVNGAGKLALSETISHAADVDLSASQTITCTVYGYDAAGKLSAAQGISDSTSDDGFGNDSAGHTVQDYTIILDQAKLLKATTTSNAVNYDGSSSNSQMITDYTYDAQGKLQSAIGNGTSSADDGCAPSASPGGLGNLQNSTITQHYFIFAGQAVLSDTANATHNQDLDGSSSDSTITTTYNYDKSSPEWRLTGATASGYSTSNDGCASSASLGGYGNITTSTITQNFTAIAGQARMVENDTASTTQNLDGSSVNSVTDLIYQYNSNGTLASAASTGNAVSNDGSGNMNYSLTDSDYAIIGGQAKLADTYTRSNSVGADLSNSLSYSQTAYTYDHGQLISVTPVLSGNWGTTYSYQGSALLGATFDSNSFDLAFNALATDFSGAALPDSLGSLSRIVTTSQSYQLYAGKNYLTQSITENKTLNPDGSTSDTTSAMDYTYTGAVLESAQGSSRGTSNDGCASSASHGGFGNITTRFEIDDYTIVANQAKLLSSSASAQTQNLDGSVNTSDTDTFYTYDNNGVLIGCTGNGTSTSNDGFGNLSASIITQGYQIICGRARLLTSEALSNSINLDGSLSNSDITTIYTYDSNGILTDCAGSGTSSSSDASGNYTDATINQSYGIIRSSAKMLTSHTVTNSTSDYEFTSATTDALTTYDYDNGGKLTGAYSDESTNGFDQYDNAYTQSVHRDYILQYGQLRQAKAVTVKETTGADWAQYTEDIWVAGDGSSSAVSAYDSHGKLLQYHEIMQETGTGTQALLNTTTTVDWQAVGYTPAGGWLTGYTQTQTVTGTNENGDPYNLTTTDTRSNISYYGAGEKYPQGLVKGYEEVTTSSDAANKSTYQKVDNITYDDFYNSVTNKTAQNRLSCEDILVTTTDTKGTLDTSDDTVIDPAIVDKTIDSYDSYDLADSWVESDTDTSGNKETQTTTTSIYDALGHIVSSTSLVNEKSISDNGVTLNQSYELDKSNIQYDTLGEATSWTQTITNQSDAIGLITQSTIIAGYYDLGRLSYYSEIGTKQDSVGTAYDESYSLVRSNFVYDDLNQAIAYHETSTSSSAPDKTIDADVTTTYLFDGNIGTQSRDTTESVPALGSQKKYNLTVTYSNYDSLNRVGTTQTVTTNSDGTSTTIVETNDQYDQAGQKIAYTEDVTETFPASAARNYTKTTAITKFDAYGQALEKTETTIEGAKTTIRATAKDILYDLTGNILEEEDTVTENGADQYGTLDNTSLSDNAFTYDQYGRIATTTSTISTQKFAGAPFTEASYSVTTNNGFDDQGRANSFITDDYSAIDPATNERTLLDYTDTELAKFNDAGQALNETVSRYSFYDQLLQFDVITNNAFDRYGNAVDVTTTSYSSADTAQAPMSSQEVVSTYDSLGRVTGQTTTFSLGAALCQRTITTNNQFDKNSQALASIVEADTYDVDSGTWQVSSVTVKNAQEDSLNNITDETVKVYSDAAQTQFQGGWVTHNDYSNTAAAALGNYTQSTTTWYSDATLSQTILKKSITENTINASGFIEKSVTTVYDGNNNPFTCEIKDNSNFNSDGDAKNVTITSQIYSNGAAQTSQITDEINTLFDRQGRVLEETITDKTAAGVVKDSSIHTNYYFSGGELESVQNFLADGTLQDKEVIRSEAMNAQGKPLISTITTYNPDGSILDAKTVYSTYDALGNAIAQNTFVSEPGSSGDLAPSLQINRTSTNFDIFGFAHDTSTITSSFDAATNGYDPVNQIATHTDNFNAQGNALDQASYTYLPDNGNWDLSVKAVTDNTYDSTGRLTQSVVDKYDANNVEWQETVTENTAFDPFDNPNAQTITTSTRDASTGQFLPSEETTRTIATNSLGWELAYTEDTVSLSGNLIETHTQYSALDSAGLPYMNARGQPTQYTETVRSYSADGAYDVTTQITRLISGYDALGQMIGYTDTITSTATADLTTTENYSNIVYDGLGNMDSYTLIDTQTGDNLDSQTTTQRTATTYDVLGRAIYYQETDTSNADSVSDQLTMNNVVYDFNNNMVSYIQTEHKTGADPVTGDTLDITETTDRLATFYNNYNQTQAYREQFNSTATPGLTTIDTVSGVNDPMTNDMSVAESAADSGIVYDSSGRLYSQKTLAHKTGADLDGAPLDTTDVILRSFTHYNGLGQVSDYSENIEHDGAGLADTEVTNRTATYYNSLGQAKGYVENSVDLTASPDLITTTQMGDYLNTNDASDVIVYNSFGEMSTYTQHVVSANSLTSALSLNVTDTTQRTITDYYADGQVKDYTEIQTSTATPALSDTVTMQAAPGQQGIGYDSLGRMVSYLRTDSESGMDSSAGATLSTITTTNRTATGYNLLGQVTNYTETSQEVCADPADLLNLTTNTQRNGITYNLAGQMSGYTDTAVQSSAPGINDVTTMSGMIYNNLGQLYSCNNNENKQSTTSPSEISNINLLANPSFNVTWVNVSPPSPGTSYTAVVELVINSITIGSTVVSLNEEVFNGASACNGWTYSSSIQGFYKNFSGVVGGQYQVYNVQISGVISIDPHTNYSSMIGSVTQTGKSVASPYATVYYGTISYNDNATVAVSVQGQPVDDSTTTVRTEIEYNNKGQLSYYKEWVNGNGAVNAAQSDISYTEFGVNSYGDRLADYNSFGDLKAYYEHTAYVSGVSGQMYRYDITYNKAGEISTFSEGNADGIAAQESYGKDGIKYALTRVYTDYKLNGQINDLEEQGQEQDQSGGAFHTYTTIKNFSYADSYNQYGQLVHYSEDAGSSKWYDSGNDLNLSIGAHQYTSDNKFLYNSNETLSFQTQTETSESKPITRITYQFNYQDARLLSTNAIGSTPSGSYLRTTQYNAATGDPTTIITINRNAGTGKVISTTVTTNTYVFPGKLQSSASVTTQGMTTTSTSTTIYSYSSTGALQSTYDVTIQGGITAKTTTTYNPNGSQTVVASTTGITDQGYNLIKKTTTQIDAMGKTTSITGTEEMWKENVSKNIKSWHGWANITMDNAGQEKVDWYNQVTHVTARRVASFIWTLFGYSMLLPVLGFLAGILGSVCGGPYSGVGGAVLGSVGSILIVSTAINLIIMAAFNYHKFEKMVFSGEAFQKVLGAIIQVAGGITSFGGGIGFDFSQGIMQGIMAALEQAFSAAISAATIAAAGSVAVQYALTNAVNWNQVGTSASIAAIAAVVAGLLKNINWGYVANGALGTAQAVVKAMPVVGGVMVGAIQSVIGALSSIIVMVSELFSQIDTLFSTTNAYISSVISAIRSQVVSVISDQISKTSKSQLGGTMFQLITSLSSQYASSSGDSGENSDSSATPLGWHQYAQAEFVAEVVGFGVGEAIDSAGIKNSYALAAVGGFENAFSQRLSADYVYDRNADAPSSTTTTVNGDKDKKVNQAQLEQSLQSFGKSADELQGYANEESRNIEDSLRVSVEDAKAELNGISSDLKPESFDELKQFTVSTNTFMENEASGAAQLAESNQFTEEKTLLRDLPAAFKNEAIMNGYTLGKDGLTIEVQAKVSDFNANIQAALKTTGLLPESQVTLVKDLIKNETYIKFDMDSSHIESYMGKEFMQQLGGIVDVGNLKTNIVDGTLQGKLYLDNKGNVIDRGISFQMKADGLVDAQAKAVADAFGAKVVSLDLRQSGKGTMTLASKLNADEIIKNLGEQNLGAIAETLSKSIGGQVLDLAKVSNVTMSLNIAKVGGQLRTTNVDKVEYAVGVDNLRDGDTKTIAAALGVTSLTLTADMSKEGKGRTFISAMQVNGENINDNTINMVMDKDKDLGNMLKSIQMRVMQNGIIDPKLVNFEIKNAVNYQGKIITTIAMSTPFDNIKPGSGLDVVLSGRASLSNQGMAYFAMTSMNPGEIVALKPPVTGAGNAGAIRESPAKQDATSRVSTTNNNSPKPPSLQDLHMDILGPNTLNSGLGPTLLPLAPTAFFYHDMAGLSEFYQAFDLARGMLLPNSFAQNLADVMVQNNVRERHASLAIQDANESPRFAKEGVGGVLNLLVGGAKSFFAEAGKSVGEFADGAISLCKIDDQVVDYYGGKISGWGNDMVQGTGTLIVDALVSNMVNQYIIEKPLIDRVVYDWNRDGGVAETLNLLSDDKLVAVTVHDKGVSQVDVRLNWFNPKHLDQVAGDLCTLMYTGNSRWGRDAKLAANSIVAEIKSGQHEIFTPGVNSDGFPKETLVQWFASLNVPEDLIVLVGHSFGTHATMLSGELCNNDKVRYILFSQRISVDEQAQIMKEGGIKPQQVLTINCAGDFPHGPNWGALFDFRTYFARVSSSVSGAFTNNITGAFIENIGKLWNSAFHGYENIDPNTGYHLFINWDGKDFNANKDMLFNIGTNHGVIDLAINNQPIRGYIVTSQGETLIVKNVTMNDVVKGFINNNLKQVLGYEE